MSEPIKPLDLDYTRLAGATGTGFGDLSEDELYTPADVTETPVVTLTNSPGCTPSGDVRPIRRARSVRTDAWSATTPASWGRSRRPVRKVQGRGRAGRSVSATPSTDWQLPF